MDPTPAIAAIANDGADVQQLGPTGLTRTAALTADPVDCPRAAARPNGTGIVAFKASCVRLFNAPSSAVRRAKAPKESRNDADCAGSRMPERKLFSAPS